MIGITPFIAGVVVFAFLLWCKDSKKIDIGQITPCKTS